MDDKCPERVIPAYSWGKSYVCNRDTVGEYNGKRYCQRHLTMHRKREERSAKWDREWEERKAESAAESELWLLLGFQKRPTYRELLARVKERLGVR